jgi:RNA polymerase sigma-70 factor (ECF subfamily)
MDMTASDDGRFRELISFREDVFRVCLGFSRNVADAEDLCQDAFLKAFARAGDLRQPGSLRIWLLRIARTTCLDHLRRMRRSPIDLADVVPDTAADPRTPETVSEANASLRRLKDAVRSLPKKQREVFVLREYGGLSYEDLGRVLKIPPGTVMSRLTRARGAITAAMKEECHE